MKIAAESESGGNYLVTTFWSLIIVVIVKWWWPDSIPFSFFEFWKPIPIGAVLKAAWPAFAWGAGVTLIVALVSLNDNDVKGEAGWMMVGGGLISTWAGVVEEVCFRWLIFYAQIAMYPLVDWFLFGWLKWLFLNVTGSIADFFTLGYLHPILFNGFGWAVGAAVLSSNGKFRAGHAYQGWLGFVNSWFMGMFFFYLMFQYGILAAILVHFLYDLFIYTASYADAVIERACGRA